MTTQENGNEHEESPDVALKASEDEQADNNNGAARRRGRAARRRRRQEAKAEPAQEQGDVTRKKDAPTPGKRQKERRNWLARFFSPVVNYFQETIAELNKVTWPNREETIRLSTIVIVVTTVFSISLGLYNFLLDSALGILLSLLQ